MAQININITLDNMDSNIDPNQLGDIIENIIKQNSGIDNVKMNMYDNDGSNSSNPIFARNIMRRVR
jgi:hypothetical protein